MIDVLAQAGRDGVERPGLQVGLDDAGGREEEEGRAGRAGGDQGQEQGDLGADAGVGEGEGADAGEVCDEEG